MTPVRTSERYRAIDIIRGLALFGVLLVNLLTDFRIPLLEHILHPPDDPVDRIATLVLEFKSWTIFSFLFGVGIAIQFDRANSPLAFLFRRFSVLFAIGVTHLFLIWNGDILTLYAICGFLLLPAVRLRPTPLFVLGALWLVLPEIAWFSFKIPPESVIAETTRIYSTGGFLDILRFRWHESWTFIIPLLRVVLPRTVALLYFGVAAWRCGVLRDPQSFRRQLLGTLVFAGIPGVVITLRPVNHVDASLLLSSAYFTGLLLFLTPRRTAKLPGLAALGQMALTNYLTQSVVCTVIFYGYGLGLFGRLGPYTTAAIGIALYILQIQFSRWWLQRYRFGPLEWLWRSLSYGKRQPLH